MAGFTNFETSDRVLNTRMNTFGNELLSEITKYSVYNLYLKAGNLMNPQKPTGAGTEVLFANITDVEKLAYTFNYAIPEDLIISKDNRYNLVIPFKQLDTNRSFVFRFLYKHEGTVIFDITRNAATTATGDLTVEFQALNQNIVDITALANTTVTLQIFVKTLTGTDAQISLLVNDVNALGRLSRNEATAIISADNVLMPDGTTSVSSAIGQLSNSAININPDFRIWQRYNAGDSTTFANPVNKYIADRYRFNGTGTVKPVTNGAEIIGTINVKYILEDADFQKLNGKTLTRSWSENGAIQKEIFVCNSAIIFDKTITNKVVNFIKIELGEIATPFSPRTYTEELAMCQRYYERMDIFGDVCWSAYYLYRGYIYFSSQKRAIPTITFASGYNGEVGKLSLHNLDSTWNKNATVTSQSLDTNRLRIYGNAEFIPDTTYAYGVIVADAEIY